MKLDSDMAYDAIKRKLICVQIMPGELFTEAMLSSEFNLGKSPVRESLKKLEQEGFVTAIPYKGYKANEITPEYLHDLMEMRKIMEGHVVKVLTDKCKDGDQRILNPISNLMAQYERKYREQDSSKEIEEQIEKGINIQFHIDLNSLYENKMFHQIIRQLYDQIARIQNFGFRVLPSRIVRSFNEHYKILTEIRNGNSIKAEELTIKHIEEVFEEVESKITNVSNAKL